MTIQFRPLAGEVILPIHYNHLIQAVLYGHIDSELATWLHDQGYSIGGRAFKLFVFSRLSGRFGRIGGNLVFRDRFQLDVASPIAHFAQSLGQSLLQAGSIRMDGNEAIVEHIAYADDAIVTDSIMVKALSPITVYSTLYTKGAGKKTYYYSPAEAEFRQQVGMNLKKKYQAFFGIEPSSDWQVKLTPVGIRSQDQAIVMFKGTVIKGWMGKYRLEGPKELLKMGLEAGLGSKNSQGFGMIGPV